MTGQGYRLLIAEDEENMLNSMKRYIVAHTTCFSTVYCATNGQQALDIIFRYHPDVMLLDVQMPIKNGLDVMREASAAGKCPKAIILSGYDTFAYAQQAMRLGVSDYLLKPCQSTLLLKTLEAAVCQEAPSESPVHGEGNHIVAQAIEYITEHMSEDLSLTQCAEICGVSSSYLSTLFTQTMGCGFIETVNNMRVSCACDYMYDSRMKVYEIAYKVGYRDEKYFSKVFKKVTGQSPSTYRRSIGIKDAETAENAENADAEEICDT